MKELLVRLAVGKACSADSDVLQKAKVFNLMPATLLVKKLWGLLIVGLDAADVIGLLQGQTKPCFTQSKKPVKTQLFPRENTAVSAHPRHLKELWLLNRCYEFRRGTTGVAQDMFPPGTL